MIADDQEIFRDGLKLVLSKAEHFELVGEAADGKELVHQVLTQQPDVVLADVVMPVMDGVEATKKIKAANDHVSVIALSMSDEEALIMDMVEAGALGYLVKNADKEEIYTAIENAYNKQPYYCHAATNQLAKMLNRKRKDLRAPAIDLTEKEIQVIRGICDEMSNADMAKELYLSKRTVDGYRSKIMDKLNVKTAVGVVKWAIKTGIYKL